MRVIPSFPHNPLLLSALILHRAQDDLINELLYRGAVISEKDDAAMDFAYFPKLDAVRRHLRQQWIGQGIEVILEITERGAGIGADDHGIRETRRIDEIDIREDRVHGLRQRIDQAVIRTGAPGIEYDGAGRCQVVAHLLKKLLRGQLEWDVGLLVGVDGDNIILLTGGRQPVTTVLDDDMQVRLVHVEILARQVNNRAVDLNAI